MNSPNTVSQLRKIRANKFNHKFILNFNEGNDNR